MEGLQSPTSTADGGTTTPFDMKLTNEFNFSISPWPRFVGYPTSAPKAPGLLANTCAHSNSYFSFTACDDGEDMPEPSASVGSKSLRAQAE